VPAFLRPYRRKLLLEAPPLALGEGAGVRGVVGRVVLEPVDRVVRHHFAPGSDDVNK